jgi:NSS family neurotransmitter:Na+ symporter
MVPTSDNASIVKTSIAVSVMDTVMALLAGLAIFPSFLPGLEPASGPGLIFLTLPIAFGHMDGGAFFGMLFCPAHIRRVDLGDL